MRRAMRPCSHLSGGRSGRPSCLYNSVPPTGASLPNQKRCPSTSGVMSRRSHVGLDRGIPTPMRFRCFSPHQSWNAPASSGPCLPSPGERLRPIPNEQEIRPHKTGYCQPARVCFPSRSDERQSLNLAGSTVHPRRNRLLAFLRKTLCIYGGLTMGRTLYLISPTSEMSVLTRIE